MSVLLSKTRKKKSQATIFAIAPSNKSISPDCFDETTNLLIAEFIKNKSLDAIKSHSITLKLDKNLHTIIICSVGTKKWDSYQLSQWSATVDNAIKDCQLDKVDIDIDSLAIATDTHNIQSLIASLCQQLHHLQYKFNRYKSDAKDKPAASINMICQQQDSATNFEYNTACAINIGKTLARDLANMPANDCNVEHLVKTARQLAKDEQVKLTLIDEKSMLKAGMGAFLAVSKGSSQEAKLIILEYRGGSNKDPLKAIIGKGLVFDTGGISLKPPGGMEEMKFDMCGAASVLGTCQAIIKLKPKINALFVVAAAENMPSGEATRPGDIVTTHQGLTVEILNTDAEGRLVLCDAISYINKLYKPQCIVDIATLTGACVVALGHHASALYSNDQQLTEQLLRASERSNDKAWHMPLWQEYQDQLNSNIADLPNISSGRDAGSITAACFLSRFAEKTPWAHLDIAGSAWISGKNKQATGRPTALLSHFLLDDK